VCHGLLVDRVWTTIDPPSTPNIGQCPRNEVNSQADIACCVLTHHLHFIEPLTRHQRPNLGQVP